jgi:hypothetical protein
VWVTRSEDKRFTAADTDVDAEDVFCKRGRIKRGGLIVVSRERVHHDYAVAVNLRFRRALAVKRLRRGAPSARVRIVGGDLEAQRVAAARVGWDAQGVAAHWARRGRRTVHRPGATPLDDRVAPAETQLGVDALEEACRTHGGGGSRRWHDRGSQRLDDRRYCSGGVECRSSVHIALRVVLVMRSRRLVRRLRCSQRCSILLPRTPRRER